MYADPNVRQAYPTRKRRPRYYKRRRRIYLPGPLLLLFALLIVFLVQRTGVSEAKVAELEEPTTTSEKISLFFDNEAPVISGVKDIFTYTGETVAYREGITVTDNKDSTPDLELDTSGVDLTQPGTYSVIYTATDASGNKTHETATVTVLEKLPEYVDMATINEAVDAQLVTILMSNMTVSDQVEAIYSWARSHLIYSEQTSRIDYHQAGYEMLTTGSGDCYGYFSVIKLMLERQGIPNIDVVKVKNSEADTEHYWSLVSTDGGSTYYHLDATPRIGEGDNFLLVTDAFLDAYSESHNNSHNRDKTLYPATPEE